MKRVVFAIDSLAGGGAERVTVELAREMQNQGVQVFLILQKPDIAYPVDDLQIIVSNSSIDSSSMYIPKILFQRKVVKIYDQLFNQIEQKYGKIDLIFSSLETNYIIFKSKYRHKCYFTIHTTISLALQKKVGKTCKYLVYIFFLRFIYKKNRVITVSKGIMRDLINQIKIRPQYLNYIYKATS